MGPQELRAIANRIRRRDLQAVFEAGAGHIGGEMSVTDLLTALYFHTMSANSSRPVGSEARPLRAEKGHTALALYIALAEKGFIPKDEISTFLKPHSRLNGHPNWDKVPGVETNTGPLGHGLPIGVGMAKAAKLNGDCWRTFVITGDGEMQEGSNWEAIMAAAQFKLDNLTLIIDHNRLQQGARLSGDQRRRTPRAQARGLWLGGRPRSTAHDMDRIVRRSRQVIAAPGPHCVVAHTNKGQGISFMSDNVAWHHKVPNDEQYKHAMAELEEAAE